VIKIYNTLSQKKEKLDLSEPIKIYVCGITPYDTTHLGHAFTFTVYDTLVRYLKFLGANVTYVQNVTDIDDDILIRAKKLGTNWRKLGQTQTEKYLKEMKALNNLPVDHFPKATENIPSMIEIIEVLAAKGLAYEKKGSVYFEIKKYKDWGKLSKLDYPAMLQIANERGNFPEDPNKRDPLDLVLWQAHKKGEPNWNSPWGKGRPGWHIECSAMSMKYSGSTVTIHGGGEDLVFPHHEAEIGISENYTGQKFVKIWMHAAMVYCEGKKMSKSLGNMIFISDLIKRYDSPTIRIFLLLHHYRRPWNFEEKEIKKAKHIAGLLKGKTNGEKMSYKEAKKTYPAFFLALEDDLNSPKAIGQLLKIAKNTDNKSKELLSTMSRVLGIF